MKEEVVANEEGSADDVADEHQNSDDNGAKPTSFRLWTKPITKDTDRKQSSQSLCSENNENNNKPKQSGLGKLFQLLVNSLFLMV